MAWRFRLYGKKRGKRRTGSRQVGRLGEALLSLLIFAGGAIGLYQMVNRMVLPEWHANRDFVEHTCRVLGGRVQETETEDAVQYWPELQMQYEFEGQKYDPWGYQINKVYFSRAEDAQEIVDQYTANPEQTFPCWINPNDPKVAVLVRRARWGVWLLLLLPGSFMVIGGGGVVYALLHSSTSAERRASLAQKAADELDLFDETTATTAAFPHVPSFAQITDSPGTELAYRLPLDAKRGWRLMGILLLALFWNVFSWAALIVLLAGERDHHALWIVIGIAPFLLLGVGILALFVRQWMITSGVGATRIEVSAHPLTPGESYSVFLSQTGRLQFNSLEVLLLCEEEATYEQGTDTRTAVQCVYRESVYRREKFDIRPGAPFEDRHSATIPSGAMHSFESPRNEVRWSLVVRGDVARWPDYERRFPIVVHPSRDRDFTSTPSFDAASTDGPLPTSPVPGESATDHGTNA